jgi:hypothetical protein
VLNIFHRGKRHEIVAVGKKALGQLVWQRRTLPDAGAQQYAFETYGTPVYDFALGNGATFIRRPLVETQPAQWAQYAWPILSNPPINTFQGQIVTQPLINPNTAQELAITVPGSIPPDAYNLIPAQGPVLAP